MRMRRCPARSAAAARYGDPPRPAAGSCRPSQGNCGRLSGPVRVDPNHQRAVFLKDHVVWDAVLVGAVCRPLFSSRSLSYRSPILLSMRALSCAYSCPSCMAASERPTVVIDEIDTQTSVTIRAASALLMCIEISRLLLVLKEFYTTSSIGVEWKRRSLAHVPPLATATRRLAGQVPVEVPPGAACRTAAPCPVSQRIPLPPPCPLSRGRVAVLRMKSHRTVFAAVLRLVDQPKHCNNRAGLRYTDWPKRICKGASASRIDCPAHLHPTLGPRPAKLALNSHGAWLL